MVIENEMGVGNRIRRGEGGEYGTEGGGQVPRMRKGDFGVGESGDVPRTRD